jgi:hypothetical protein
MNMLTGPHYSGFFGAPGMSGFFGAGPVFGGYGMGATTRPTRRATKRA